VIQIIRIFPAIIIFFGFLMAQPDPKFDSFDWVLYSDPNAINSISEGNEYVYFGTESGGILRYNYYGQYFEEAITTAQGLPENRITAVYFDHYTGILWAATSDKLNYSYTALGDWYSIDLSEYGLNSGSELIQIGSSEEYIWARTLTMNIKCDHASGIFLGQFITPDQNEIYWSSDQFFPYDDFSQLLGDYSIAGKWNIFGNGLIGPYGQTVGITTYYRGEHSNSWIGSSTGIILHSLPGMNSFEAIEYGLNTTDIQFILPGSGFWLGGQIAMDQESGISRFDPGRSVFERYYFDEFLGMQLQSSYSGLVVDDEIWIGGEGQILIYNNKKDDWNTINELHGITSGKILTMTQDSSSVWVGSTRGLSRISKSTKRSIFTGLESYYNERFVYFLFQHDNEIWIGTDYEVKIFDFEENIVYDLGQLIGDKIVNYSVMKYFTAYTSFEGKIYIGSQNGIIVYDPISTTFSLIQSGLYNNAIIRKMVVSDDYLWLIANNILFRIGRDGSSVRQYNYNFIGTLNDLYISGDYLWLGSSSGLIKFNWQRDL